MFSALLNWFKLEYGPFGQSNIHRTLHLIFAQTSQEGIECTKVEEYLRACCLNSYTVNIVLFLQD